MTPYVTNLISAAAMVVGLVGVLLLHGGWDAAAAGLDVFAGAAFLVSLIVLLARSERRPPRGVRPHFT